MARVLVVDDEEGIRSFLSEALELAGHEVRTAQSGQEGLNACREQAFHVVLTDLKMPGMSGMELLSTLQSEQPETQVIMLTAHGTVATAVQAMRAGAFDYLQKPISGLTELRLLVARAMAQHRAQARAEAKRSPPRLILTWGAPAMMGPVKALNRVAPTEATVLLLGESGTGKEVAARALHERSKRSSGPFVAVNCAALRGELLESELFGHERGAFTGASSRKRGLLELAEGGTFFLDEVGELAPQLQARLLRVLQEKRFSRVGGTQLLHADVRWVAATNRDLQAQVAQGVFRADLFHRLALFPIELPPLRERLEDLEPLCERLLNRIGESMGRPDLSLSMEARSSLRTHPWSGNIRELANALERGAIMCEGSELQPGDLMLMASPGAAGPAVRTLAQAEERVIRAALTECSSNRRQAAQMLGIGERTLYDKIKRYGI